MTPSMLIPCSAVLVQHLGRIPYATRSNVAMRRRSRHETNSFPITITYISKKISRSRLRYFSSYPSKRCLKLGRQIHRRFLTWVNPFFYLRCIAQAHPLIPAKSGPCYGAA